MDLGEFYQKLNGMPSPRPNVRDEDPVLAKNWIRGSVPQKKGDFKKSYRTVILDNFKSIIFCLQTFSVRLSL